MIKFNFASEWGLTQGDINWLRDYYFATKLAEAVQWIQQIRAIDGHAFDPARTSRFTNNIPEVNVLLKADNWATPNGGAAGTFWEAGPDYNSAIPSIWINWTRETDPTNNLYSRVVRHELIHMLLWMQYPPVDGDLQRYSEEYLNSAHGRQAPDKDIFLLSLNKRIKEYYPDNNSSTPGTLPTP